MIRLWTLYVRLLDLGVTVILSLKEIKLLVFTLRASMVTVSIGHAENQNLNRLTELSGAF